MNEKCAITLHSCISVTDQVKMNEQYKSPGAGSLYVYYAVYTKIELN